jgi:segregation and condensation protein A
VNTEALPDDEDSPDATDEASSTPVSERGESEAVTDGAKPQQGEMPFALVQGEPFVELPKDLYIPPDALEVFLETFEGPLDLLLYLIRRQNLDILDIPIAQVTHQYVEYVELMQEMRLELAAEYLVMAAMLAEIKARMLMPRRPSDEEDEEHDPRAELVRRLQEYERYKLTAEELDLLPRDGRDTWAAEVSVPDMEQEREVPDFELSDLLSALRDVMARAELFTHHRIQLEPLSVRERMSSILSSLSAENYVNFTALFTVEEGRRGVVVTLLAILELVREQLVELSQLQAFGPIRVRGMA